MKTNKTSKLKMENGVLKGGFSFLTTSQISKIKGGIKKELDKNTSCHNLSLCSGDNPGCTNDSQCTGTE